MPFTAGGSTTGAALIRQSYVPMWADAVYLNNDLMKYFSSPVDSGGDTSFRWILHSAVNSGVEVFSEGQGIPDFGAQGWVQAAVSYVHIRGVMQITGHARAAMRANWVNGIEEEAIQLKKQIGDLWTTSFMGSTYGLQNAILASGSYAGLTRGSISYFEGYTTAVSDAISYTTLMNTYRIMKDNDRGAKPDLILCPWNQVQRLYNITGQPAVKQITDANSAPNFENAAFANCQIAGIGDMTDTVLFMLDRSPGMFENIVHRNWEVKELAPSGDSDCYQIVYAGALVCKNPIKQAQLTSLTA